MAFFQVVALDLDGTDASTWSAIWGNSACNSAAMRPETG